MQRIADLAMNDQPGDICFDCKHRRDEHVGRLCVGQMSRLHYPFFTTRGCVCREFKKATLIRKPDAGYDVGAEKLAAKGRGE